MIHVPSRALVVLFLIGLFIAPSRANPLRVAPLRVAVSTPDVASLTTEIGGGEVQVFCFSKGPEDPHVIELLPSHVGQMRQAELFIQVGLGIEDAWLPGLVARAANDRIRPGSTGHLDLSAGVRRLEAEAPGGAAPDSLHEEGNPHYLLDPVEGLKAARVICDRLVALRPAARAGFEARHRGFVRQWAETCLGARIASRADLGVLEEYADAASLERHLGDLLKDAGSADGALGRLATHRGAVIVGDHDLWPYFARRSGLEILGYLEPSPGVPPSTRHLGQLIRRMQEARVRAVLSAPYFDPRHGRLVSDRTGAQVVPMAHQTGSRPGATNYLSMIGYNADQAARALGEGGR